MSPEKILKEITFSWNQGYICGIRGDSRSISIGCKISDYPNLTGPCAASVDYSPTHSADENLIGINRAISLAGRYGGPNMYLLRGSDFFFGDANHDREIILIEAEIVAKII